MTTLSVNVLLGAYANEPAMERALWSWLDRTPIQAVHLSARAKAEQGFSVAKKTRAAVDWKRGF